MVHFIIPWGMRNKADHFDLQYNGKFLLAIGYIFCLVLLSIRRGGGNRGREEGKQGKDHGAEWKEGRKKRRRKLTSPKGLIGVQGARPFQSGEI